MPGEGGSVDDRTVTEVAVSMRRLVAAIEAGELSCSVGYLARLRGAVVALEAVASAPEQPGHRGGQLDASKAR
jgi:hypothetical protein